ncbi:methylated-DNA--[protein]-cysteine S-methyltransferase [Micromonospora sp. WMMD882]|uniref:methylated-DNA--[protein]-cysteine S-methyltransferase n=1 Tax=Micromonospora sp. WMMD882 TaxID=3015151 RepID=UPI00248B9B8A|nr:methylated-DNA--[protein]-cysteine S-methyltransferase [Micromonospora sp. WMMD882]WBB78334.1 methylated-DNA--[protein]-cysteine S-methyltransferase [Micromonospora sp. WMMD882]
MRWTVLDTPIGDLSVAVADGAVCGVRFGRVEPPTAEPPGGPPATESPAGPPAAEPPGGPGAGDDELSRWAAAELDAYFAGELTGFTVPVAVRRGSEFERAVWQAMTRIPYGGTLTYGEVAKALGDPGAARAVGVACNRNPLPVIVPCHRIVGAGGKLVGFGGGLPRKVHLLELEARVTLQRAWS